MIETTWRNVLDTLSRMKEVIFIDLLRIPREEVAVSNFDISTNRGNLMHSRYPQYDGADLHVSVKEQRFDTADIDIKGRIVQTPFSSPTLSSHATIMATIIAGGGNSYYEGKGFAYGTWVSSADFTTLMPETQAAYDQYNISVQNHSYGTGIENYYGADAMAYDQSVVSRTLLVHAFSAGNAGGQASTTGIYAGIAGFANLTGSFKMAKNIITVGHTDSTGNIMSASSRGPAFDGRVRPELVAFGLDGSSGAAAIVSGSAATLQHAYKNLHGAIPSSALIKAVLLNSADDAGPKGIDFFSGYGSVNAYKAMRTLVNGNFQTGVVNQASTHTHTLVIPSGIRQLKLTLAWIDPPAIPNSTKALRNDIDMELALPTTGLTWQPWVLSHFPHADSLRQLPIRKRDSLNNVEQITIEYPLPGIYEIRVRGFDIRDGNSQAYAYAFRMDTVGKFSWNYPTRQDHLFPGRLHALRWESTRTENTGLLEYSMDGGSNWHFISSAVDLSAGYFKWTPPEALTLALLRVKVGMETFVSDTFVISGRINTSVGFNCPDSFQFYWNKMDDADAYRIYQLGDKYLEAFRETGDTTIILAKATHPSRYYAVAPVIDGRLGVRSYAFDYSTQGVECYVRSFRGQVEGNSGKFVLILGTNYNIIGIALEKLINGVYVPVQNITSVTATSVLFTDTPLIQGANVYRVRIDLGGGRVIHSPSETIYYLGQSDYLLFPNPLRIGVEATILSTPAGENGTIEIFNAMGQRVMRKEVEGFSTTITTSGWRPGLYFFRIIRTDGVSSLLRLIVY